MTVEIHRIDLIHLAHDLDPAAFPIFRAILKTEMLKLIEMSMILMISPHRMMAHYPILGHEHSARLRKT